MTLQIETPRLFVKSHMLANLEKFHQYENDQELLYYDDDGPDDREPETIEKTNDYLKRIIENPLDSNKIYYAIHKNEPDTFIGYGMIYFLNRHNRSCMLGIVIGEKSEWGKGYAREALTAIVTYCFNTLEVNRIGAGVYEFNERSIRLFERVGFKREGVTRQSILRRGQFYDEIQYGLLKSEW